MLFVAFSIFSLFLIFVSLINMCLSMFLLEFILYRILYVCVFIPVLPLGSSEPIFLFFFRFHIYVLAYGICFSLSDLLHSV